MFKINNKKFYLNKEEFQIHSGSFHYFRALPEYWEDILTKIKAAGFNCVETYTCWNLHEPKKGHFDFSGMLDLERFLTTAQKVGLYVILRTGPFICGEWENGGLPAWLLKDPSLRMRCDSEPYMTHLSDWFHHLLPLIKPHLETNGGPVLAMAVENEYGTFGDDFSYLGKVRDIYRREGIDCLLFASDGSDRYFFCTGKADSALLQASDFGVGNAKNEVRKIDEYDDSMPYFCVEYWAGNFTCWGYDQCHKDDPDKVKKDVEEMLEIDASFNVYMLFGGTNFAFTSGANMVQFPPVGSRFGPMTTSYDYDAAITEWGGYTRRYFDMKAAIEAHNGKPADIPVPPSPKLQNVGAVTLTESASLFDNTHLASFFHSSTVECMEHFDQTNGYILYRKTMDYDYPFRYLHMEQIRDRAHVFVNGSLIGIRERSVDESSVSIPFPLKKGDVIEILVENMGRICFSNETYLGDRKGILGGVFLCDNENGRGKCAFNWDILTFEMNNTEKVIYKEGTNEAFPAFFRGHFKAENQNSCFVHFDNFKKGVIYVNGFNLGRYWERGPQTALYLPGAILKEDNTIVVFETDGLKGEPILCINDTHGLGDHNPEVLV